MEQKTYRIRVRLQSCEIEVEGDKEFVKEEIRALLEEFQKIHEVFSSQREPAQKLESMPEQKKPYIKEFIEEKNPSGAQQTAVVLAYYLKEYEGKETFNKEDIKKIWIASGRKPPRKIWQSVIDGKNRYQWFEEVSRGEYKISPHGIYFVRDELPKKRRGNE